MAHPACILLVYICHLGKYRLLNQIVEVTMDQQSLLLSSCSFFFVLVFLYTRFSTSKTPLKNPPPSPPKLPIIGNLHQINQDPHLALRSLAQKYGPVMQLHFGSVPVLVVSSADAAKEIMKTHDLAFANRPDSTIWSRIFYNGKDVSFAPYSEYWRQVKMICVTQLLSNKRVRSFHNVREQEVALLVQNIKDSRSKIINLSELFSTHLGNVVSRVVLGRKYAMTTKDGVENSFRELFQNIAQLIGYFSFGDYIPWLFWVDSLTGLKGRIEKAFFEADAFLEGVVRDHSVALDNGASSDDLLYNLLEIQKQDSNPDFSIDNESIKGLILNMFFDGTDSTSIVLEWTMAALLQNPNVMCKLQNEVREIGRGKATISEDDLEKMHYLKAVIKESTRIYTPLPLLVARQAMQDAKVMGYDIKVGTQVLINAWAIAKDPAVWDKPEEFIPERFLNSPTDFKGLHFELIPFGAGRRGCPGIQYAMAINELTLANLVHIFDFALPDGKRLEDLDMAAESGMTLHKKSPLLVIATPRV
ncbi:psoralen synthase-like [Daucus carota subsp. sativus]|nr:PREDICTED: psoralen synthase-like [Daucus carota subsp. sativus]XP_017241292.1 PREDICTED: psoralen synthase-like [Daucus carota subsp. sativus]